MNNSEAGTTRPLASELPSAPQFETRIYFVHRDLSYWSNLDNDIASGLLEQSLLRSRHGRDFWVVNTYARLKARGLNVSLVDDFVADAICIAHSDDIEAVVEQNDSYVVAIRADRERQFLCDIEVVQSPASIESSNAFFQQNWPQPGLTQRSNTRGNRLETLGFLGQLRNLSAGFRSPQFRDALNELDIELIIREERSTWWDYRDIDVVIAVRDGSPHFLASKPSSKLVNAWLAGCPALVGNEPAFSDLHRNDYDFITVNGPDDAIAVLRNLKLHPETYHKYREQAKVRAREFTVDGITDRWEDLLRNIVIPRYRVWKKASGPFGKCVRWTKFQWRLVRRKLRGYRYTRGYDLEGNPVTRQYSWRRRAAWLGDDLISAYEQRRIVGRISTEE